MHLNIDPRSHAMCLHMYTNLKKGEILTLSFYQSYFAPNEADATTQQRRCQESRQLKFQGFTTQEWVIRVGPEFYLILDQNDQDIYF